MTPPVLTSEAFWRRLFIAGCTASMLVFIYLAFFVPGTLTYAPFTIQDDARQFLAWTSRIANPLAMKGDLIADYWQSVSPPFYRAIYGTAAMVGLSPVLFSKLLPVALMAFCAWMAWRIARRMGRSPLVAFLAAAFLMGFLIHEDSIYSATPRAFSAPLFLLFLDGLQRDRARVMIPALFLEALIYPATALVGLTMLALSRIGMRPWRIDFAMRTWLLGIAGAVAFLGAAVPFQSQTQRWEPTVTVAQALQLPNLGTPEGRSTIVGLDGQIDYLCSARMGVLTEVVPCWSTPHAVWPNLLLMLPMFALAAITLRRRSYTPGDPPGDLLHVWVLVAGIAWWIVAVLVAFKLHLPSRFTQRTVPIMEFLAIGQVAGIALENLLAKHKRLAASLLAGFVGLFLTASFLSPTPGLRRPSDPQAIAAISALPKDTLIGGVTDELGAIPALTGRPVLATIEHSIPYHRGYFVPLENRLRASLAAVSSPDPAVLENYVRSQGVKVIAIDRALLRRGELPPSYATVVPDAAKTAEAALAAGPSALQQRAPGCMMHDGDLVLLDAACLANRPSARD